jgi:hypothetical protein
LFIFVVLKSEGDLERLTALATEATALKKELTGLKTDIGTV